MRDKELEEAYRKAVYTALAKDTKVKFHVDQKSKQLDELLSEQNAESFAFITAFNPYSKKLGANENRERHERLRQMLEAENYRFLAAFGMNEDETGDREEAFVVLNISEDEAVKTAQKFEQNAIVCGAKNAPPRLVWTA